MCGTYSGFHKCPHVYDFLIKSSVKKDPANKDTLKVTQNEAPVLENKMAYRSFKNSCMMHKYG
jgi:hypothetical protein